MSRTKTKLKFTKSDKTGSWVGFVSIDTTTGCLRGIRENAKLPKKVCVVTHELAPYIEEGVLYDVTMVPMKDKNKGYIVTSAEPHAFEARIERTVVRNAVYLVEVKFGNKVIQYDPLDSEHKHICCLKDVIKTLNSRKDIKNHTLVVDDFIKAANTVLLACENDGHYISESYK